MPTPHFNQKADVNYDDTATLDFTLTLVPTSGDALARAQAFKATLERWPLLRHTQDARVRLDSASADVSASGQPQVKIKATEAALQDIQRQFAGDILKVNPQPDPVPPSRRVRPVDPFDVRFW